MDSGVATKPILDMAAYRHELRARLNPTTSVLTLAYEGARAHPKRVLFAEGEEEVVLRAAIAFREGGYGTPVLVGRDDVPDRLRALGVSDPESYELHNSRTSTLVPKMVDFLYARLQRRGFLKRDCERMINQDRNIFGAVLLQLGEADAMITGITRTYAHTMREVRKVIDPMAGRTPFGIHLMVGKAHTVFMADTTINERPSAEELADIAEGTAAVARRMGHEPRVAFLSYSTFGNPEGKWLENLREAVTVLDRRKVSFEYEGEMAPDVALNPRQLANYPFARLSGPANVLIMPGLQSANISAKLLRETGRRCGDRPDAGWHGKAGADCTNDLDRRGTGDAGCARGGRDRALATAPPRAGEVYSLQTGFSCQYIGHDRLSERPCDVDPADRGGGDRCGDVAARAGDRAFCFPGGDGGFAGVCRAADRAARALRPGLCAHRRYAAPW